MGISRLAPGVGVSDPRMATGRIGSGARLWYPTIAALRYHATTPDTRIMTGPSTHLPERDRGPLVQEGGPGSSRPAGAVRAPDDPVIRAAIRNVEANLAALSASEIVQLVLFPSSLSGWAAEADVDEAQVGNLLRHYRPYVALRAALAERLGVTQAILVHLIEARRALPASKRLPDAERVLRDAGIDWARPPYPLVRDGTNPLEQLALRRLELDAPAMPASRVVGLALWPETLAGWARAHGRCSLSNVLACLGGVLRHDYILDGIARRLDVSRTALDRFIAAEKRLSVSDRPGGASAVAVPPA